MKKMKELLDKVLATCCMVLCGMLVVLVTWQVVTRFVLKNPSAVTEELANITFVWLVLFATALLFGEKGHMNIGIIPEKVSKKTALVFSIISEIATTIFASWILLKGGALIVSRAISQTNAAMPFLSTGEIYMAIPICGVCTVFYGIYNIMNDSKKLFLKEE